MLYVRTHEVADNASKMIVQKDVNNGLAVHMAFYLAYLYDLFEGNLKETKENVEKVRQNRPKNLLPALTDEELFKAIVSLLNRIQDEDGYYVTDEEKEILKDVYRIQKECPWGIGEAHFRPIPRALKKGILFCNQSPDWTNTRTLVKEIRSFEDANQYPSLLT